MPGIPFKFYFYIAFALALLSAGGYTAYRWMEADNLKVQHERDTALAAASGLKAENGNLQRNFDDADEIAKRRGTALVDAQRKLDRFEQALVTKANSPAAVSWRGTPVPSDVRLLRRTDAKCAADLQLPCPADFVAADTGTLDERRDEPQSHGGGKPATLRPPSLQWGQGGGTELGATRGSEGWSAFARRADGKIVPVAVVEVITTQVREPKEPKEPRQ